MGELDAIPAPPREVRWKAALRRRWVLGLVGVTTFVPCAIVLAVFAAMGLDVLPLKDDMLDAGCSLTTAEVVSIESTGLHSGDERFDRVGFRFDVGDGRTVTGTSFVPQGSRFTAGGPCTVEYLADDPDIARIRGTRRNPLGTIWSVFFGLVLLPSIAVALFWLRGVMRLKLLLARGRLSVARIVTRKMVVGVNPAQWRVDYEFDDLSGRAVTGSHCVGARSPLGLRLAEDISSAPVVFDEGDPGKSRLVHRSDFRT